MKAENLSSEDINVVHAALHDYCVKLRERAHIIKTNKPDNVNERYWKALQIANDEAQYVEILLAKFKCTSAVLVTDNKG